MVGDNEQNLMKNMHLSLISQKVFPDWHPLKSDWLEGLAIEIKESAQYAQQCLRDNKRSDREMLDAIMQIKAWQQIRPEFIDKRSPEIVVNERLGAQLASHTFADFLSGHEFTGALKPYEFAALALLQETHGLADLSVVAKRDSISICAQHFTFKIARLHVATVLLRMQDASPQRQHLVQTILVALFNNEEGQL